MEVPASLQDAFFGRALPATMWLANFRSPYGTKTRRDDGERDAAGARRFGFDGFHVYFMTQWATAYHMQSGQVTTPIGIDTDSGIFGVILIKANPPTKTTTTNPAQSKMVA